MGNKRSLKKKKNPSAAQNWVNISGKPYMKNAGEEAMKKVKKMRKGKQFKLIQNPNGPGMIEVEV